MHLSSISRASHLSARVLSLCTKLSPCLLAWLGLYPPQNLNLQVCYPIILVFHNSIYYLLSVWYEIHSSTLAFMRQSSVHMPSAFGCLLSMTNIKLGIFLPIASAGSPWPKSWALPSKLDSKLSIFLLILDFKHGIRDVNGRFGRGFSKNIGSPFFQAKKPYLKPFGGYENRPLPFRFFRTSFSGLDF